MPDYTNNIVKKYKYWTVYAKTNQEYLGGCIIWCDREDADDLTDATAEEIQEFLQIIRQLKKALEKAFHADWMNYSFLGNADKHLHCHLVPRYKDIREFVGVIFKDKRWGNNWIIDNDFVTSEKLLQAVKVKIQENL